APVRAAAPPRPAARPESAPAAAVSEAVAAPLAPPVRGERAERIAALDWPALREAVAACQACGLHAGRTQTVFGVGQVPAHWMVVGEAPGEQEDRQGEPFVGPAGQLLDAMLRAIGLGRGASDPAHQAYIANTLKCRPPRNRNPAPDELLHCEPFLQRQIALVQPRIILAMGKFAIQQLTGSDEPVGRLRGRVHRYQGVPVVVTYHPAYLLRQPSEKAKAWDDLRLARRVYAQAISSAP
ncbi:uracil-DNA glycosylase, partial [Ideonella sp. 4Y11]